MTAFATPQPITATLTTAGAQVRVAASERSDTVVRVEPIDRTNKSHVKVAEQTKVDFAAGRLSIETKKAGDKDGSVAITVELPAGSQLVLNTAWSQVRADGTFGSCELNIASGRIEVDRVAALRGQLAAGEVAIGHVAGTANIEGAAAGVRIGEVAGLVTYTGSSGPVWIGHARSDVHLTGAGADGFEIDRAEGDVIIKAANCPIRIGQLAQGYAELTNAAGGIEVGVVAGVGASVDAESTKGSVRNSVPAQDSLVKIYARTRKDDIVIHPAAV
ncbi:hypothetical protein AB0J74_20770 [Asanoa sp. NPDC049573]|uniref:hypothetical protein n=1 Tax=Asanoa sp. NPDC049573 TaxID=3155396 RepID=UPI003423E4EE